MRLAASVAASLALAAAAAAARAQDRDPFDAVREQEALRARQTVQIHRAEDRIVEPFRADPSGGGRTPAPPAPVKSRGGGVPVGLLLLGGAAAVAAIAFWTLRDRGDGSGRR